jgi:hypothetical protein
MFVSVFSARTLTVALITIAFKEENWISDPNAFVDDEDEENPTFTLRIATQDLIYNLIDSLRNPAIVALWAAFQARISESDQLKTSGQVDWCVCSLGIMWL